jgi:hypothetical protein
MKRRLYLTAFAIYWTITGFVFLAPGVLWYIVSGNDVWNKYMDKMYTRFLKL